MSFKQKNFGSIKFLIDGKSAFNQIIKRIRKAKKSIFINMFIWRDDKIGNIIARELLDSANKGVKITISKDMLGVVFERAEEKKQSFFHKDFNLFFWFKYKLIDFFYYTPGESSSSKQKFNELAHSLLNHKNIFVEKDCVKKDHSKYYIFDDEILILGGMNIEDRTVYHDVRGVLWNDYMVEFNGKRFVRELNLGFKGRKFRNECGVDFVFNTTKYIKRFEIKNVILKLLSSAKKNVDVQMAYFGDKDISNMIVEIANKGVKVSIILPKKSNLQNDLNFKVLKDILARAEGNVKVFLCKNMIHSKMVVVDDNTVLLGSANFSKQTMNKLSELDVLIHRKSSGFLNGIRKSLNFHKKNSKLIHNVDQLRFNKFKAFLEGFF